MVAGFNANVYMFFSDRSSEGEERACPKARDLNLGHQSPSPQTGTTPGCLYGKVRQGRATKHRGKCWNTLQSCTFSPAGVVEAACPAPITATAVRV